MTELSGLVAILADPGGLGAAVLDVRNLGPDPVPVKSGRVIPLVEVFPTILQGEELSGSSIMHDGVTATRTWLKRTMKTVAELDQDTLNNALAEEGGLVRAMAEVMLSEINLLRVQAGLPQRTKLQFVAALKAKMRTP